jgi:hypothetical protein
MNPDDICLSFTIENNELKISHTPTLIDIHTNAPVTLQLVLFHFILLVITHLIFVNHSNVRCEFSFP